MSRTVAIHSFRGGTGKSNVASNLGALLARSGKRVAVVDTDIQSPGLHALFGLGEDIPWALNDFLWDRCPIESAAYDAGEHLLPPGSDGALWVVPARISANDIARVLSQGYNVEKLNEALHQLALHLGLDVLLMDTHPGLHEETLLTLSICDVLLVLLRPDEQDFQGTAVTVEVARQLEVRNMLIALNMVMPSIDAEALAHQVGKIYHAPVAAVISRADELALLGSRDLLCIRQPDHHFCQQLRHLAGALFD
ncbi:MAG TPA: MinD/ParA family protein [Chloroflexota bacterium]|nr:MinD/ParA family protein [Chloroflexota bacterium]